jgi:N-acetyl-anhydromuramyl-L-alanine amidase AmpD
MFNGQQVSGLNSYSIGIECEGPPSFLKWEKTWSASFLSSLVNLCRYIKERVPSIMLITDHSTISPQLGKTDMLGGKGIDSFPWVELVSGSGLKDGATAEMRSLVRAHYGVK